MILAKAMGALRGQGTGSGSQQRHVRPDRGLSRTPWQIALQAWLEGAAPGERTYQRASRRGAGHGEVVMPGRKRHSWRLSVILDTSASMSDEVPRALGAIADFCDMAGVDEIRVIQCDTTVTSGETLSPSALAGYGISGYGRACRGCAHHRGGDITDGEIDYPQEPPPYAVLWALPKASPSFQPPYGRVVTLETGASS
ncbi:VWA-like domain-containing protein [Pseudochelatococcus contaminans]|uniref:Putative metal-dependent peptidase n=1 Tax=Pseudochelatococcus contaminans TaxID=1538103 RepID=A0A7W5Z6T9_9HYPH|nr:VWA-like domain-containing protein [Pseudochelatococcus contaminans]MBB3810571.1 putative metal-dependent peptidase [Pseudochelatococcus contaminans]